ncbi:MAG TPA: SRPBCC family protein [Pyrinomonadaceae bacterium]|jgi:hypothetical protein
MHRVERVIEIDAPVERVFELFSDFESFPRWMRHVREVHRSGRRYTRWRADTPLGMDIEWEAETTIFEPDRRIAWRSVRGDVETDGEVVFSELAPRRTRLRIVLGYAPPAGRLGDAFARLLGRDPAEELREDLQRFKRLAERADGGRGRRSTPARADYERRRADYERGREDYEGRAVARARRAEPRSDERYYQDVLDMRGRDEFDGPPGDEFDESPRHARADEPRRSSARARTRDEYARSYEEYDEERRGSSARYGEDVELTRERRFDEALRAARRSQTEALRRAQPHPSAAWRRMVEAEQRIEREAGRRDEDRRAPRGGRHERERAPGRRPDDERPRRGPERPRYAMTPRERERERAELGWDREARAYLLRRRVDRLIDEGPSHDWRRWE